MNTSYGRERPSRQGPQSDSYGKLPARRPDRTWGGPGVGAPCAVCNEPVMKDQLELEVQFARERAVPGLDKFHIHVRCFAAWEFERTNHGARS